MNSKLGALKQKIAGPAASAVANDPRRTARIVLGILLAANVVAAVAAFRPWTESAEALEAQNIEIRREELQRRAQIERLKLLAGKSETARNEGDRFLSQHFLPREKAASTLVNELNLMAKASGVKPKEHAFAFEPIEGSDNLAIGSISANYEASYPDLLKYVNQLDRSPRFFIVESMGATPQQGNLGTLNIQMKVNVFIRETAPEMPGPRAALDAPAEVRQ